MATLAVIPARGGSKGIPRKNMRLMGGKPLIQYAIQTALSCKHIDTVAISTDSEEIATFASQFNAILVVNRNSDLAKDAVTLDPVIYDAVQKCEKKLLCRFDTVVTLQPTSPLLSRDTLSNALDYFAEKNLDSLISVVNSPHLSWTTGPDGSVVPEYKKRLNRQQLPPRYLETGAFLIARRNSMTPESRLGSKVGVFETPECEAVDIDTREDWAICEALLSRKKIVFRVDGYSQLGMGHIYRALTLAYSLVNHDITFICNKKYKQGIQKLQLANMHVIEIGENSELLAWLKSNRPDVFVNDCLDTTADYVNSITPFVNRFVSFEDLGEGARSADAVVNEIYETGCDLPHIYTGKRYVCLRDEFLTTHAKEFSATVERVLVMFGGTDPLDLTRRVYNAAQIYNAKNSHVRFDFILGSGYNHDTLRSIESASIFVMQDVSRVSDYMKKADLAFSSQGRTTFELASMGVPTIVLAQNEREQLHTFAQMDNGFINLGLGSEVSDEDILSALEWLIKSTSIRKEMHTLMLQNDLRSGIKRVRQIILGEIDR
ncbi:MAG: acylneuraminate cytidylyltransferase [Eggerthellaceae bacterium]